MRAPFIGRLPTAIAVALLAMAFARANAGRSPPAKPPLRILVGFTAGGTTDQAARVLAEHLQDSLGRPVIIDNRPGASGRIAAVALKHAAPDGTTFMLAPMVVTTLAPMVWPQLDYDPARDFAPVAHVANYAIALAVNGEFPARNLSDFVAWTKTSPERAHYGVSAAGGLPHLFGVMVARATATPWVAVPYRGLAPLSVDLVGGHIAGRDGRAFQSDRTAPWRKDQDHRDVRARGDLRWFPMSRRFGNRGSTPSRATAGSRCMRRPARRSRRGRGLGCDRRNLAHSGGPCADDSSRLRADGNHREGTGGDHCRGRCSLGARHQGTGLCRGVEVLRTRRSCAQPIFGWCVTICREIAKPWSWASRC